MNEQFYELPEEKRLRIINAGLEVFAKNDYKHAVTDEMAAKAGISKGLLFYYFHNKKSLYLYLIEYCARMIMDQVMDDHFYEITDFFELIDYAADRKLSMMEKTPYLADFVTRCFYSEDKEVVQELSLAPIGTTSNLFRECFMNVDYSKFREGISPREVYDMLLWMTDGYLHERLRTGVPFRLDEMKAVYVKWERRLKQIAYKKEFLEAEGQPVSEGCAGGTGEGVSGTGGCAGGTGGCADGTGEGVSGTGGGADGI